MIIQTKKYIYTLLLLFILFFIAYIVLLENYIFNSEKSYTNAVKDEIQTLIHQKELDTFMIAKNLAKDKKLIQALEKKEYKQFYTSNFITLPQEYLKYHNIRIHIVDQYGKQRYFSWTKKDLGKDVLTARDDLRILYKHPRPMHSISVGKFSLAFKGIMPIYGKNHKFLGIIETITFFNSIADSLEKSSIASAVVIDKKFYTRLKYPISKTFISNYNIANINIEKNILSLLSKENIDYFLRNKSYHYIVNNNSYLESGYYAITVPIHNITQQTIAYYLAFIKDKNYLMQKEVLLHLVLFLFSLLFLDIVYLALKEYKKNLKLIENLDHEVKKQIEEKTKLLYIDSKN